MVSTIKLRSLGNLSAAMLLVFAVACGPSLTLTDVDYAQPIESVMAPDDLGNVQDVRMGVGFNVTPLNVKELGDNALLPSQVRMIRSSDGYYFVTAPGYTSVYVFEASESTLELVEVIAVNAAGLSNPAFNQRSPHIQLIDGDTEFRLTRNGIVN